MDVLGFSVASPSSFTPGKFECVHWDELDMDYPMYGGPDDSSQSLFDAAPDPNTEITTAGEPVSNQRRRALRRRARPLLATEWDRLRPEIVNLYIQEDRELGDVRRLMRERWGFEAKPHMYKKRLKAWGAHKNMTREEKHEIFLSQQSAGTAEGDKMHPGTEIRVNARPFRQHKIDRYRRDYMRQSVQRHNARGPLFRRDLFYSNEELCLRLTKGFTAEFLSRPEDFMGWAGSGDELDFYRLVLTGRDLLRRAPSKAFAMFNRACDISAAAIRNVGSLFVLRLLDAFSGTGWSHRTEIRQKLLEYLEGVARALHGKTHLTSRLLKSVLGDLNLAHVKAAVPWVMLQEVESVQHAHDVNMIQFQLYLLRDTQDDDCDNSVQAALARIREQAERSLPTKDSLHEDVQLTQISLNQSLGRLEEAERGYLALLQSEVNRHGSEIDSGLAWSCYCGLGDIYYDQDRLDEAEKYFRLTVDEAIRLYGEEDVGVVECLEDLETLLLENGKEDEVEQLRRDYAGVYAQLDGWYLTGTVVEEI